MLWRKALKDLAMRRIRTALTVVGILVGVAGLVAIITSAQGFARAQQQAFTTGQRADLAIYLYYAPLSFLRAVERIPGVRVAEQMTPFALIVSPPCDVWGLPPDSAFCLP